MTRLRPVARDDMPFGWPIVAGQRAEHDDACPSRTPVTHSYAALALYTGGRSRVEQGAAFHLSEGDVLLVPPGTPHRMLEARGVVYWGLAFCVPCFGADGAATLLAPFERVRDGASAVVRIPLDRQEFLQRLFRELTRTCDEPRAAGAALEAVQRSLLTLILHEIDQAHGQSPPATRGGVVTDSLRFIEKSCLRRVTLDDIAAAVGRSPAHVTSALKQATGRSAGEWIVSGRMAEARRLLLHSDERVDVVAERVGYADATHFIRMFRRAHGATPAAWRAERRRGPGA
jgi:AraC family transcriptional regulator, transcriptional activator of pobA